jgi:hypothetical protein
LRRVSVDMAGTLPESYKTEGLELRNKLLLFRLRNQAHIVPLSKQIAGTSPRITQMYNPLLSLVDDEKDREVIIGLALKHNRDLVQSRGMDIEARVLEAYLDHAKRSKKPYVRVKDLSGYIEKNYGKDFDRIISPRYIGWVLRTKLHIRPLQREGVFVVRFADHDRLDALCAQFGIKPQTSTEEDATGE